MSVYRFKADVVQFFEVEAENEAEAREEMLASSLSDWNHGDCAVSLVEVRGADTPEGERGPVIEPDPFPELPTAPPVVAPCASPVCAWLRKIRRQVYVNMARGFNRIQAINLCRLQGRHLEVAETLLKTKSFRSAFRKSLASQLRAWLDSARHEYETPFSAKQMYALTKWHQ